MKLLIISHPPVATQNNMGKTFLSLLSRFDRDELCQLYIYPSFPDVDRCASWYRVTDKEVLRSWLGHRNIGAEVPGEAVRADQGMYENEADRALYRNRKNKSALRRLARDAMWKFSPWYNRNLIQWLDRQAPDCIFVAPGVGKFLYDMALKISRERRIPVVTYICDEYYFVRNPDSGLDRIRLALLRRKIGQLMENTSHLVVISQELKDAYSEKFGVEASVLMTGASGPEGSSVKRDTPRNLCYFGNVRCNRYVSLARIGRELDTINQETGENYRLKIYTGERDPEILKVLSEPSSVELCGFVAGVEYEKAFSQADLLLHTEAFDEASMDFTRHSVSTKIAEALASGIPLVAYGPECLSSMKHLLRHGCALTATEPEALHCVLRKAFEDASAREIVVRRAAETAQTCHDSHRNSLALREIIEKVLSEQNG